MVHVAETVAILEQGWGAGWVTRGSPSEARDGNLLSEHPVSAQGNEPAVGARKQLVLLKTVRGNCKAPTPAKESQAGGLQKGSQVLPPLALIWDGPQLW